MFYPTTYPLPSAWRPNFSQRLRAWLTALTPPLATQILLQAGDGYHLAAGRYRLRALAGTLWAPGMGLIDAGEQVTLTVDAAGLALQSHAQPAAVFSVQVRG